MNLREQMTRAYDLNMSLPKDSRWWPENIAVVGSSFPRFLVCGEGNRYRETVDNESAAWALIMYCAQQWVLSQIGGEGAPIDERNATVGGFWAQPIEFLTVHTRRVV